SQACPASAAVGRGEGGIASGAGRAIFRTCGPKRRTDRKCLFEREWRQPAADQHFHDRDVAPGAWRRALLLRQRDRGMVRPCVCALAIPAPADAQSLNGRLKKLAAPTGGRGAPEPPRSGVALPDGATAPGAAWVARLRDRTPLSRRGYGPWQDRRRFGFGA